jgi:hypothetical protein
MLRNVLEGWQGKKCRLRPVLFSLTGPQVIPLSIHFCSEGMLNYGLPYSQAL